ncbi:gamma-glutamylcyclotransferase [Idiomarina sp. WRN-38]|jgi:cation transport regulator ChaC|uniref:glutathione-specific gamma-glutamylcyclotransferase n=1 Tax=Vreelandella aquamarina TaxID=77097 RepID=A0A1H8LJE1_9GAMM|nr:MULTISPECIES: gamma-glutamylcyclotransferase [Halomonas]KTG25130.1 gamma-glutamylcyclotransferase [Idiomarina sp. H105]MEC8900778.1 gamma-glutamylcyclotransferase [Pseudomonadota bacterium]OAE94834.1 gamma-glutamylcyclotransferase [Idiomarina sp. WRN-38]MCP1304193.1 gamma-glutamylcyclotransferase [Halomonas sp. R1t8]MCP1330364.1 gamma-glutamylcyclotransferase [Halomonas sp. R1t4]
MLLDTTTLNQQRNFFDGHADIWLFGYGSLIWKADFDYLERRPAAITGWARRFWQGSHDHRGTPDAPGRVATLIRAEGAVCHGMAYRITPEVLAPLDVREKNGYLREKVTLTFLDETGNPDADQAPSEGLIYLASEDNPAFLGDAPLADIAQQIAQAHGPSGPNSAYLLNLAQALRELGTEDAHIFALEAQLQRYQ